MDNRISSIFRTRINEFQNDINKLSITTKKKDVNIGYIDAIQNLQNNFAALANNTDNDDINVLRGAIGHTKTAWEASLLQANKFTDTQRGVISSTMNQLKQLKYELQDNIDQRIVNRPPENPLTVSPYQIGENLKGLFGKADDNKYNNNQTKKFTQNRNISKDPARFVTGVIKQLTQEDTYNSINAGGEEALIDHIFKGHVGNQKDGNILDGHWLVEDREDYLGAEKTDITQFHQGLFKGITNILASGLVSSNIAISGRNGLFNIKIPFNDMNYENVSGKKFKENNFFTGNPRNHDDFKRGLESINVTLRKTKTTAKKDDGTPASKGYAIDSVYPEFKYFS